MKYFIIENNQQVGPFSIYELKDKGITSDTLVWAEGMKEWTPPWQVEELKAFLYNTTSTSTPPPVPPVTPQPTADAPQPTPSPLAQQPQKNHKTGIIIGAVVVLLLLIMIFTCPSKKDHEEAIQEKISLAIDKSAGQSDDIFSQGISILSKLFARQLSGPILDNVLQYHNYVLFSTTTIEWEGKTHKASYGLFGHIFTVDEDDIVKALEKESVPSFSDNQSDDNDNQQDDEAVEQDSVSNNSSSVDQKLINSVGNMVKDQVKEKADSATKEGLGKIVDDIFDFLKGL
jgi:hypothetical protein